MATLTPKTSPLLPFSRDSVEEELMKSTGNYTRERIRPKTLPTWLYHYTSMDGVEGVLKSNVIHASNIAFMNDESELEHGVWLVNQTLESFSISKAEPTSIPPSDLLAIESIRYVIRNAQTMLQAYVACFCRVDDLLSQWRAYGASDAAYSMRFSAARLNRQIQPWSLLAPVEYLGHNQVDRAHELITTIRSALRQFDVQAKDITESNISFVASIVQFPMAIVVLLMKHPAFKEEKEWRLVYGPLFFDEKDRAKVSVKFRRGVAIPYVEIGSVGQDDQPRDIPVRGLRVGPHKDSAMAATGLKHLLTSLNRSDVSVASSTTPLR